MLPEWPPAGNQGNLLQPKQEAGNLLQPKQEAEEDEGLRRRGINLSPLVDSRCCPSHEEGGEGIGMGMGMERCGMHLVEDAAAGAFLSWEDILASSPEPALDDGGGSLGEVVANAQEESLAGMEGLGGGMVAPTAAAAASAAGRFPNELGDIFRKRSHSDPVSHDSGGLDSSWELAMGGGTLDLGRLAAEPADDCRIRQGGGAEAEPEAEAGAGGGSVGRGGQRGMGEIGQRIHRARATQNNDLALADRGIRSVSDSAAWGVPAPQWGLPANSAGWELLLPRGFAAATAAPFSAGNGAAGAAAAARAAATGGEGLLSGVDTQAQQGQTLPSSLCNNLPAEDGGLPVSLSDVDLSGLLLTPEEMFCPGAGDLTNSNLQALSMFNPTLLRNFPCGNYGGSSGNGNNFAGLAYPALAAATGATATGSGEWTSATPHGLGLGLVAGEAGVAVALDPAAGPRAQQPDGMSSGRDGAQAETSVSVSAMDFSMGIAP